MSKNKKNKTPGRGPKVPVYQQAQGRTRPSTPKSKVNGMDQGKQHHFSEFMTKHSGMNSPADRAACESMMKPSCDGPPVVPTSRTTFQAGATYYKEYMPRPGQVYYESRRRTVTIGASGWGYIGALNGCQGFGNVNDAVETSAAFNDTALILSGTGVANYPSSALHGLDASLNSSYSWTATTLGMKWTLEVDQAKAQDREASVLAVAWHGDVNAINFANIVTEAGVREFPASVFASGEEISVTAPRTPSSFTASVAGSIGATHLFLEARGWTGLVFSGLPGHNFIVRVEHRYFVDGVTIAPTVCPLVSDAAVNCAMYCLMALQTKTAGSTGRENGRHVQQVHTSAEHMSLATVPRALLSAAWPTIKQLASTGGAALFQRILGLL